MISLSRFVFFRRPAFVLACVLAFSFESLFAESPLDTDKRKTSYALGRNIGSSFAEQEIEIDEEAFLEGFDTGFAKEVSRLTDEQMQNLLVELERQTLEKRRLKKELSLLGNREREKEFLDANGKREGVVTTPSGLQYEILKAGQGEKPLAADSVRTHYEGSLLNGEVFDSSYRRGAPATFPVNRVIPGWTEALQLMPVGSKWKLFVPASLAYGDSPPPGSSIEPGSTLVFEVELLEIVN